MNDWDLDTGKIINMKQNRLGTESLRTSSTSSMCVYVWYVCVTLTLDKGKYSFSI